MKDLDKHIEQITESYRPPVIRSKEEAWQMLSNRIDPIEAKPAKTRSLYWISGLAAACVLVFLGLVQWGAFSPQQETQIAAQQKVWLPDSSMVWLNSRSKINYNYQLIGGNRHIKLEGEAYFKVEKGKPFQVEFPGGSLRVLGTEFNVSAYAKDFIRIDCVSGKVEVDINNKKVTLEKNMGVTCKGDKVQEPFEIRAQDVENRMKGYFTWTAEPLNDVFRCLEYRFGYTFVSERSLMDKNISATAVPVTDLKQTLDMLAAAMQFNYQIDETKKQVRVETR